MRVYCFLLYPERTITEIPHTLKHFATYDVHLKQMFKEKNSRLSYVRYVTRFYSPNIRKPHQFCNCKRARL